MNITSNGRVDILGPIGPQFFLSDKIPIKHCVSYRDALTGQWENTLLSCAFFSSENIQILQNMLKRGEMCFDLNILEVNGIERIISDQTAFTS